MQFLGRISYSLYLIHGVVGYRTLSVGERLTGDGPAAAMGWLVVALAASLLTAWIMYQAVETPSSSLARRLKPS